MTFDELEKEAIAVFGVHLRDVNQTHAHYGLWVARFKPRGTAQEKWKAYNAHPEGMALCPPYRDVWHWLLDRTEHIDWVEKRSRRFKDYTLTSRELSPEWVKMVLAPLVAMHGGKIDLHLSVDT